MFTINNPDHQLDKPTGPAWQSASYIVYQEESGADGTPHYQGYVEFSQRKRLTALKKINRRAHWEVRRGSQEQAINYCKKTSTRVAGPYEIGEPASTEQGKRTDLDAIGKKIIEGASLREVALEHPGAYMQYGKGMRDLKAQIAESYNHDDVRGHWYWGPPGTGKSRKAREENPDAYIKAQNKWFDGYAGEAVILLDDLDSNCLGHYLKIWADRYSCPGEVKGSSVNLVHTKIIITSNYSIDDLWPEDSEMCAAIKRRFKVTYFNQLPAADTTSAPPKRSKKGKVPDPCARKGTPSTLPNRPNHKCLHCPADLPCMCAQDAYMTTLSNGGSVAEAVASAALAVPEPLIE